MCEWTGRKKGPPDRTHTLKDVKGRWAGEQKSDECMREMSGGMRMTRRGESVRETRDRENSKSSGLRFSGKDLIQSMQDRQLASFSERPVVYGHRGKTGCFVVGDASEEVLRSPQVLLGANQCVRIRIMMHSYRALFKNCVPAPPARRCATSGDLACYQRVATCPRPVQLST